VCPASAINGNPDRVDTFGSDDVEYDEIKAAVKEVMDVRMKEFYIDREEHYQDHQFLKGLREWSDGIKSTTIKTLVTLVVTALIGFVVLGFIVWGKKKMGQ
jgi:hypothetical protein